MSSRGGKSPCVRSNASDDHGDRSSFDELDGRRATSSSTTQRSRTARDVTLFFRCVLSSSCDVL
jgi:hypothetical protein